ncbi:MAG: hypothetical protein JSW07_17685 [bacterium]|nr:MAG: hypothetical protein JSW07_17685 [bacterium]
MSKIDRILIDIQRNLRESLEPYCVENLNGYERKRIHCFFDNKEDYETRTYRQEGRFVLKVIPVGNLKRLAKENAEKVMQTRETVVMPYLGNYERFIIHNYLKDFEGIETKSVGEGSDRRLEIKQAKFGRSLKRIIKKIKLL